MLTIAVSPAPSERLKNTQGAVALPEHHTAGPYPLAMQLALRLHCSRT
jgi:hypothetical protein